MQVSLNIWDINKQINKYMHLLPYTSYALSPGYARQSIFTKAAQSMKIV